MEDARTFIGYRCLRFLETRKASVHKDLVSEISRLLRLGAASERVIRPIVSTRLWTTVFKLKRIDSIEEESKVGVQFESVS